MTVEKLALFTGAALLITLSPGPDIITVVTRSISQGVAAGLVATLGFASGLIFHTAMATISQSIIIRQSPIAFRIIQFLGVAYLLYLAVRTFLSKDGISLEKRPGEERPLLRIYGQSVLMNVLNPKVWLFFFSLVWPWVDPQSALPQWLQTVILGAIFAGCTILCFGACSLVAGGLTDFIRSNPKATRPLRLATGCVFVLIAVMFLMARMSDRK